MSIGTLEGLDLSIEYPELTGKRVLVTGVAGAVGVDVVRAFAEAGTRLIVQAPEDNAECRALAEIIAPYAMEVQLQPGAFTDADAMLRFAREAAQRFGGLDVVANIAHCPEPPARADEAAIEALVAETLAMPVLATRVAINRMRTMLAEGSIVNIVAGSRGATGRGRLLAAIARASLAAFTRAEAEAASAYDIRVNAIVPADGLAGDVRALEGSADIASLTMHLASGRSHALSGLAFEAWCG